MTAQLRPALVIFALLTLLTGIVYPLAVTGLAQAMFSAQANGSLLHRDGSTVGSELIGQDFSGNPKYFWGRLSATGPAPYTALSTDKAMGSSGSNLGPNNPAQLANARARIEALRAADSAVGFVRPADQKVPVDLVTSSASGLDPSISLAAAEYQAARVAKVRGLSEVRVQGFIRQCTRDRQFRVLGEPTVNVLELNLALDAAVR